MQGHAPVPRGDFSRYRAGDRQGLIMSALSAQRDMNDHPAAQPHVLVVENHPTVMRMISAMLGQAGFVVTAASKPRDAMLALDSYKPDVVLLGMRFPACDGLAIASEIRNSRMHGDVVILAMSGPSDKYAREDALRGGCDGLIVKPFTVQQLAGELRAALAERHGVTPDAGRQRTFTASSDARPATQRWI